MIEKTERSDSLPTPNPTFPKQSLVRTTDPIARLGRITAVPGENAEAGAYYTVADLSSGQPFYRMEADLSSCFETPLYDYRLADLQPNDLSEAQALPWRIDVNVTPHGVFLTLDHPDLGRNHIAIEIDRGNILIQPTRDPNIRPDTAIRITPTGTSIEQSNAPHLPPASHTLLQPEKAPTIIYAPTPPGIA
jgi:hypothetical protein